MVITGTNLTGASAVTFGGTAATAYTVDSPTQITATSPAHSAGTVQVQVTTVGGSTADTVADNFTYVTGPSISGLSPTSGPTAGGTSVVITGTNLVGLSGLQPSPSGALNATSYTVDLRHPDHGRCPCSEPLPGPCGCR